MTERLVLALPLPEDAARVCDYYQRNRDYLAPTSPPRPPDYWTLSFWRAALAKAQREATEQTALRYRIFMKAAQDGPMIGNCQFSGVTRGPFQACFLGYDLDPDYQHQGLMTEALKGALEQVFERWKLHRVMANYLPENQASGRLLRRLGFKVEGYARDYLFINGAWRDHILTSLLNPRPEDVPVSR